MKIDRRTIKTRHLIKRAFTDIVHEKPINKITVKEIANLAGVNRSTFYQHFKDVYEVHEAVLEDFATEFIRLFRERGYQYHKEDTERSLRGLINYMQDNEKIFKILVRHDESVLVDKMSRKLIYYAKESKYEGYVRNPEQFVCAVYFLMHGIIGLLKKWFDQELNYSLAEVGNLIYTFIINGFVLKNQH